MDERGGILAVNDRLLDRLGYGRADVVGRLAWSDLLSVGSRVFWQTQLAPVLQLDGVLQEVMLDLRDAAGQRIPALLNAVRISDPGGGTAGVLVAAMIVSDRRAYEDELRQARVDAEHAQAAEHRARLRLELLAQASGALAGSLDIQVALSRLATVLVAGLADWCVLYATDPDRPDDPAWWAAEHADHTQQHNVERLAEILPHHALPSSAFSRVAGGGEPEFLAHVDAEHQRDSTDSAEVLELYDRLGLGSAIVVPSTVRGDRVATMILVRRPNRAEFSADDLQDLTDLGARAGLAFDTLRQRAREHSNSIALQQALLTSPPVTPGFEIVTRYLPATAGNEVGGDWYDAFPQSDGTPILVIGDVVGHDIHAAAAMGQLRGVMRTLAYPAVVEPAEILTNTDTTAQGLGVGVLASAFLARLQRDCDEVTLTWSNAGHPPPLLLRADGTVRLLAAHPDPILGALGLFGARPRQQHTDRLSPGDTLLLYTDGLVEQIDEDIDAGINAVSRRLTAGHGLPLDQLCDLVLVEHQAGRRDDIALLLLRVLA